MMEMVGEEIGIEAETEAEIEIEIEIGAQIQMIEEGMKGEVDRDPLENVVEVDREIGMIEGEEGADRHLLGIEGEADLQEVKIDTDIDFVL